MGELNSESKPYSLKAHPKSITLPDIKNKETPENTVNTPFPRATTFIFLLTDILLPHVSSCLDSYQNCVLNPYGYGDHIHARRWKHIQYWLSFVETYP